MTLGMAESLAIESASPPQRDFEILKALALVLAFAAWNATYEALYDHFRFDTPSRTDALRITFILVGTLVACCGIVGLGCVVWAKRSLASLGWRAPDPTLLVLLGLLLTVLLFAGVFAMAAVLGGSEQVRDFTLAIVHMPAGERVFFALMGARDAFVEETVFRGLLLTSLARRMSAPAAIVLTSVVFGLYHRELFPVPLLLMKMALGTLLSVFALVSRSLVPSWIAHSLLWAIAGAN
jgi:membrane protease YdiL (CAAX protease family)